MNNLIPQAAIEKAIEGGWRNGRAWRGQNDAYTYEWCCVVALDPTFWQALGKALGWGYYDNESGERVELRNAHRLYDLTLTGGDTEKFWQEILK